MSEKTKIQESLSAHAHKAAENCAHGIQALAQLVLATITADQQSSHDALTKAEQQRDAAHAALLDCARVIGPDRMFQVSNETVAALQAALAASAPQKEEQ